MWVQYHGEGPRPKPLRQEICHIRNMVTEQGQLLRPCDMQNERVVTGPALGLKDFGHGLRMDQPALLCRHDFVATDWLLLSGKAGAPTEKAGRWF